VNVKVELNCPARGISRVEINTPQNLNYTTSGLCGNTFLNDGVLSCSLHYENEKGDTVCSDSSEVLGNAWRVKTNIDWQLDLQVRNESIWMESTGFL
jgi:hypothetical protein